MTAEGKNLPAADKATFLLIQPRGFCAGVIRASEDVEPALQKLGRPVYPRRASGQPPEMLGLRPASEGSGLDPGGCPICFAGGIDKLKIHSQGEPEHFMTRRNQAESDTRRGVQRLTYAEVRFDENLQEVIQRAVDHLLSLQAPEGYWVGELEADTTLESDYIFFLYVLGKLDNRRCVKLANYIRRRQLPDGGWNIYAGGPSELNATVKAYVALKLAGDSPAAPHMARARCQIHDLGGVEATNSYTRLYLALGGVLPWSYVPAIPPELILIPSWFFLNIYSMSSWTRAIVVPLMLVYARKPHWDLPPNAGVEELFRDASGRIPAFEWDRRLVSWRNFFLVLDRLFKLHEKLPWKPLRQRALRTRQAVAPRTPGAHRGARRNLSRHGQLGICLAGLGLLGR